MPLKRETKTKERRDGDGVTLEHTAETLARLVDDAKARVDEQRLTAARKLGPLDRLYLAALRKRAAGELTPLDSREVPPLSIGRLLGLGELIEAHVRLMDDDKVARERRRLKAAGELSQSDQLYRAALRERHARSKTMKTRRQEGTR